MPKDKGHCHLLSETFRFTMSCDECGTVIVQRLRIRESGLLRSAQDIYILCLLRAQGISQMSEKKENGGKDCKLLSSGQL